MRDLISSVGALVRPANKAPVPYTGRGRTGLWAGLGRAGGPQDREQQAAAMSGNGTLFSVVSQLALDASAVDWHMHRFRPGSQDECPLDGCDATGVELVDGHAALDTWNNPNDFFSRQELVETVQQHLDLTGEGWPLFSRIKGVPWPVEIWPVYPHRMSPVPDRERYLSGYVYASPDGEMVPLALNEVGLMRQPHPLDVMRGLSAVGALSVDLDTASAARVWNRNFFLNSAQPGGIVKVPRRLSDDEFEEMTARWREQHQGVSAAHRVAILEGEGTDWETVQYSMKDLQFTELLGVSRGAILEAYRFPESMLGASGDVNRATANTHKAQYMENLIVPRLQRWRGMLNRKFLPTFGATAVGLEFAFCSPVPADAEAQNAERESKANAAKTYVDAGFEGESVKEALGLPETLVWEGREAVQQPVEPSAGRNAARGQPADSWHDAVHALTGRRPRNATEEAAQVDLDGLQADWQAQLDALLADWDGVTEAWRDDIADRVRVAVNAGDLAALGALTVGSAAAAEVLIAAMAEIAASGAQRAADEAAAQGHAAEAGVVAAATIAGIAGVAATLLATGYVLAGAREALRWQGYGRDGDEVSAGVRAALKAVNAPKGWLGGMLTWAQNMGRMATFRLLSAVGAKWYASEANDRSTCLAPNVLVTTRRGKVPAASITTDDELLTHGGRWVKPSAITITDVDEDLVSFELGRAELFPEVRVGVLAHVAAVDEATLRPAMAADLAVSGRLQRPLQQPPKAVRAGLAAGPDRDVLSAVEAGRVDGPRLTADHPVLVVRDGLVGWRDAGEVTVGDLVIPEALAEDGRELQIPDLRLGKAPHNVIPVDQIGCLAPVDVRAQRVPVAPVGFDDQVVADEEVHHPWANWRLAQKPKRIGFQQQPHVALDAGLCAAGAVTTRRAEPPSAFGRWNDTELGAAVLAVDGDGRPAAGLGAVAARLVSGMSKVGAAATATACESTAARAGTRAVGKSVSNGPGHREVGVTSGAGLGDALAGWSHLGADVGVGELAGDRAVNGPVSGSAGDFLPAHLANRVRVSGGSTLSDPGRSTGAGQTQRTLLDGTGALRTRPIHGLSVLVVRSIRRVPHRGSVYDFTIPGDHTLFADGVLVHNCDPCSKIDGKRLPTLDAMMLAYGGGGYLFCEGRERCRGTAVAVWK